MDEKPKSIWKKLRKVPGLFGAWLVIVVATFLVLLAFAFWQQSGPSFNWLLALFYMLLLGAIVATIFLLLWLFIHRLCNWKNFRRFVFVLACLATLTALFYAEENWRGKREWENYKREWTAKGEQFDYADFIPPSVPDDQNMAMAPVFDARRKLASRQWRSEHRNPDPKNGMAWDTNLADPLDIQIGSGNYNEWPTNDGNWQLAKTADLKEWQDYYRTLAAATNLFPVAPQPQTPAQDVLLALSKYNSAIEGLRDAAKRPESRFPVDYDDEDPAEILLPHLGALKKCSQVLQLRALAELENNETDKAFEDVKLSLRLVDCIRTEPFIITHLVRRAILLIALQPVYEGLAEHKWSDAQLAEFDAELAKINFLADYEFSTRSERAANVKIIDWLEQNRSRYWEFLAMLENGAHRQDDVVKNFAATSAFYLMPKGWFYQNEVVLAQLEQQWSLSGVDDAAQTISPRKTAQADEAVKSISHARPFDLFACILLPALGNFAQKTAYGQNAVNMARVAIALERYHLAHGNFPDSLDVLAPQYLEKIPHDVIGGQSLKYRHEPDGQFILYSIGWNETDDGGVVVFKKGSSSEVDIGEGDWVWRYPQK